jgi:hypothetical protein
MDASGDKDRRNTRHWKKHIAMDQIKKLIKKISGSWDVSILVTSDHGFLYHNALKKWQKKHRRAKGYTKDNSRFVIADNFEGKIDGYVFWYENTTNIDTD